MNTVWLSEIDQSIANNKLIVEQAEALKRLQQSRDFKKVIVEGYLNNLAVKLVHLKGHPSSKDQAEQQSIMAQLDAIGHFNQYLNQITAAAEQAKKVMDADEQTREELLSQDN